MRMRRLVAGVSISLTGVAIVVPNLLAFGRAGLGVVGSVVGAFGVLTGLALVVGGAWITRSDLVGEHAMRVAGWNLLGVVALGTVLALVSLYPGADLPLFVAAVVMGVSAVAHVLIGLNDVRRIRASELARERQKLAVVNRLTRHNLRNDTQIIVGLADAIQAQADDEDVAGHAERLAAETEQLSSLNEDLKQFQSAIERDSADDHPIELAPLVADLVEPFRSRYPAASITVDVPDSLAVMADDHVEVALEHLVENALAYGGDEPAVTVAAERDGRFVSLTVSDDGPGIPQVEREVLLGERDVTQLEHGSGIGLYTAKAVAESYGGDIDVSVDDGTTVELRLPAA